MKKSMRIAALLTVAAMTTGLAGCSGSGQPAETAAPTTAAPTAAEASGDTAAPEAAGGMELTTSNQNFILATQGVDTTVYSRMAAIVEVLGKGTLGSNTIEIQPISTGGAAGALLLEENQCSFASGSNVPGKRLAEGTYGEGRAPLQNLSLIHI